MSASNKELKLPVGLPTCGCFASDDMVFTMERCAAVAKSCHTMVSVFLQLAQNERLCKDALPYFAEVLMISLLTSIAKSNGPALEYGSKEIEWEFERLLTGIEARILTRSRDVYARSREMGITEENLKAMVERDAKGSQS